jgi:hypothetical protein
MAAQSQVRQTSTAVPASTKNGCLHIPHVRGFFTGPASDQTLGNRGAVNPERNCSVSMTAAA